MTDSKILTKVQSVLSGQQILWQGEALLADFTNKGKSQAYAAVTATGLHFFAKKTFGVSSQTAAPSEIHEVAAGGISVNMDNGKSLDGVMFKLNRSSVVLVPLSQGPDTITVLGDALKSLTGVSTETGSA